MEEASKARPALSMVLLEQIQDYEAGEDSPALRKHREVQLCYKTSESHKISGYLVSLFVGFGGNRDKLMKLNQEPPRDKEAPGHRWP